MTKFRWDRPITDYARVQKWIGNFKRNSKNQVKSSFQHKKYLDVGCGPNTHDHFVNLDYLWTPNLDVCWDITTKELPFPDNRFEGIFTEHCLEHIPFEACKKVLKEFFRVLKPGGIARIIVPDGELYLDKYQEQKGGEPLHMPYGKGYISPLHRINGIFREHGHLFIYDFETFKVMLQEIGFSGVEKKTFMNGANRELLIDSEHRKIESLYLEATK